MDSAEIPVEGGSSTSGSSESSAAAADDKTNFKKTPDSDSKVEAFQYSGWVYHLGVNSIGHEYCHLRFLLLRGSYVQMYKRDPAQNPGLKPIRRGAIGHTLMVEELGRRKLNRGDFYVLRFYNRLDETKKGEIACATAGEVRNWREAFDHAKQVAESEIIRGGSARTKLNMDTEIDLDGHRPRVRRYTKGLKKLVKIGQGPEMLLRQSSSLVAADRPNAYMEEDGSDVIEAHEWRCVRTINGVRILEDASNSKNSKGVLIKAVAVVDASADTVFEVLLSLDRHKRYEWDTLTGSLELLDSFDGHYDVVYGTFDQKYSTWWQSKKRDFVFSRQWFNGQDGAYTILQFPAKHKSRPPKSGFRRTKINPSTWEIRDLKTPSSPKIVRCLVTQMLEVSSKKWFTWRNNQSSSFEKSVSYAFLSQVAGLKEYVGANPALAFDSHTTIVQEKLSDASETNDEFEDSEGVDEFYDAIATGSSSSEDDDSDDDTEGNNNARKIKLKNVGWAIAGLALKRAKATGVNREFNPNVPAINIDPSQFKGSMRQGKSDVDSDCWTSPSGSGFMIRGETYLKDSTKVSGGVPLLKLIAVDWFKVENSVSQISLHPRCLVQSDIGKKVPFILVINLQVPAKPNYSLVLYFAADKPVNKNSLLGRFIDGTDMFRDSRFKLIPSISQGYWMVKRAVGSKACLLGKAVTCKYLRQDNFLEIDVDIGSSSVARSIINLVLGYVTSLVVDLAIVIEAKEETELPEYILGAVRLNRVRVDSALPLEI